LFHGLIRLSAAQARLEAAYFAAGMTTNE